MKGCLFFLTILKWLLEDHTANVVRTSFNIAIKDCKNCNIAEIINRKSVQVIAYAAYIVRIIKDRNSLRETEENRKLETEERKSGSETNRNRDETEYPKVDRRNRIGNRKCVEKG